MSNESDLIIENIGDYISFLRNLEENTCIKGMSENLMFRGQSNCTWPLLPKYFRRNTDGTRIYSSGIEEIMVSFQREAFPYIMKLNPKAINDKSIENLMSSNHFEHEDLQLMQIAQHYGVPTKLLDFTRNPLVALYFACAEESNNDGCVWLVNTISYSNLYTNCLMNSITIDPTFNKFKKFPRICEQNLVDNRMANQESLFFYIPLETPIDLLMPIDLHMSTLNLISKFNKRTEEVISKTATSITTHVTREDMKELIGKIIIPKKQTSVIRKQLNLLGINEKLIYPGLDGIGRYIDVVYQNR